MFKRILSTLLAFAFILLSVSPASAVSDVVTNSSVWSRNNVNNVDIATSGLAVGTTFALAADDDTVEVAVMIRNTGNTVSGTLELWRVGDMTGYVTNSLRKYQSGTWTDLNADWTNLNTEGLKLSLGTLAAGAYVRLVYQTDVGNGHVFGDILQDYIKLYEGAALVKTMSVSTYVPYVKVSSASNADDTVVLTSAVELLQSVAETVTNYEISKDGGNNYTQLSAPDTASYNATNRTITLTQSQVDFDAGDSIQVRLSNLKTADDLRYLNPPDFTSTGSSVITATLNASDTTAPTFTAGLDTTAGTNGTLLVEFNEAMDTNTLTTANLLARTTFNNGHDLGTAPSLSWTSTSTVKILLDADGDVIAGDTLTLDNTITDTAGNGVVGTATTISTLLVDPPFITAFTLADQSSADTAYTDNATLDVAAFTATDADGEIRGYLINENSATPSAAAINNLSAPTTYTLTGGEGARTVYAWVKDDDDHVTGTSAVITQDLTAPTVSADVASGTYNSSQTVTLSFSAEASPDKIYYTLDGSAPDSSGTRIQYTAPLSINSNLSLTFIGYDMLGRFSPVASRDYQFVCNPSTIGNGSVGAYPLCTLTCNNGYILSGNSCNPQSGSSSGGGGGGGGSNVNTTSIYSLPTFASDKTVETYRPIQISGDVFTRPVEMTNYYTQAVAEIPFETQVTDLNGNPISDVIFNQIDRIKSSAAEEDLRIPLPPQSLVYASYYQFGNLEEKFSKNIKLFIPLSSSILKKEPADYHIYKWVPAPTATSSQDGTVYRAGEWVLLGDGSLVDADGVLQVEIDHSTLIAFTKPGNSPADADDGLPFKDITGHWAQDFIVALFNQGVVNGKTAESFAPNDNLTRAELTKIALNSFGYTVPEEISEQPFEDVELDQWYAVYIQKGKEVGIIDGYQDGSFRPNQPVNRAEALKILLEALSNAAQEPLVFDSEDLDVEFADVEEGAWYMPYVAYAKANSIIEGYLLEDEAGENKPYFKPSQFITRAEIAKIALLLMEGE